MKSSDSSHRNEYRTCPFSGRMSIIAPCRADRPMCLPGSLYVGHQQSGRDACPFCPGAEEATPGEVYAVRPSDRLPNQPGWQLRIVPNKFPAVSDQLDSSAYGIHELVIETNKHLIDPSELSVAEFELILSAYQTRLRVLESMPGIHSVTIFKNVGADAGASLEHTHSQILATPFVPTGLQRELALGELALQQGQELWLRETSQLLENQDRLVARTEDMLLATAYAPRMNFEMQLFPLAMAASFSAASQTELNQCAILLRQAVRALGTIIPHAAFNWWLHTAPSHANQSHSFDRVFRWHFELLPRTARIAGFEWASDAYIVDMPPELAAQRLRAEFQQHSI